MIQLPEIDSLAHAPEHLSLRFVVPATLQYFEGHFPGCPLLPGVVQIGWAVELARKHLSLQARFHTLAGVKFMHVIQPATPVELRLALDDGRRLLQFEYRRAELTCSSGRVLFH